MQNSILYNFCYKLKLFGVKRSMKHKTKTIHKIASGNSTISIPIKSVCD